MTQRLSAMELLRPLTAFAVALSLHAAATATAEDAAIAVSIQEPWSGVFGGKEAVFHVTVTARERAAGRVAWEFSSAGHTIARGEREVAVGPARPETVEVRLAVPPVKDDVVMPAALAAAFQGPAGAAAASAARPVWIFAENAFADRRQRLKDMGIRLFDPQGKTAETFTDAGVPFDAVRSVDAFESAYGAVLVIGEGVSFEENRGLWEAMLRAAAADTTVVCLAPAAGALPMPGMGGEGLPRPSRVAFRQRDVIGELDKRLDSAGWPADGQVVCSTLKPGSVRGTVVAEIAVGDLGWPWVEWGFGQRGRVVVCGFGIVRQWKAGPAPRYLLRRMFEVIEDNAGSGKQKGK